MNASKMLAVVLFEQGEKQSTKWTRGKALEHT